MDYRSLMGLAQRNNDTVKESIVKRYSTDFTPAKKDPKSHVQSKAIKAFLARKDEEKKHQEEDAIRKKEMLLSLRAQNAKNNKRAKVMASRTKDNDFSRIKLSEDELEAKKKREVELQRKMLTDKVERMKARIAMEERDQQLPHKRKRKAKHTSESDSHEEQVPEIQEEPPAPRVEYRFSGGSVPLAIVRHQEKSELQPAKPKVRPPPGNPIAFHDLLKLAAVKQHEPVAIKKPPKITDEEERPKTKKQLEQDRLGVTRPGSKPHKTDSSDLKHTQRDGGSGRHAPLSTSKSPHSNTDNSKPESNRMRINGDMKRSSLMVPTNYRTQHQNVEPDMQFDQEYIDYPSYNTEPEQPVRTPKEKKKEDGRLKQSKNEHVNPLAREKHQPKPVISRTEQSHLTKERTSFDSNDLQKFSAMPQYMSSRGSKLSQEGKSSQKSLVPKDRHCTSSKRLPVKDEPAGTKMVTSRLQDHKLSPSESRPLSARKGEQMAVRNDILHEMPSARSSFCPAKGEKMPVRSSQVKSVSSGKEKFPPSVNKPAQFSSRSPVPNSAGHSLPSHHAKPVEALHGPNIKRGPALSVFSEQRSSTLPRFPEERRAVQSRQFGAPKERKAVNLPQSHSEQKVVQSRVHEEKRPVHLKVSEERQVKPPQGHVERRLAQSKVSDGRRPVQSVQPPQDHLERRLAQSKVSEGRRPVQSVQPRGPDERRPLEPRQPKGLKERQPAKLSSEHKGTPVKPVSRDPYRHPPLSRNPFKRRFPDEDEEEEDDMADFIDDDPVDDDMDYSKHIREIFGYDPRKYIMDGYDDDDDDEAMESSYAQQMKEEIRSAHIGLLEDLEDIRREEEEQRRLRMKKKGRKK